MIDLGVDLCGVKLNSPFVLASGIMGLSASSLARMARAGAAAVTSKSVGLEERKGHPCPVILPFGHGLLNAVGLSNPGVDEMMRELSELRTQSPVPIICSIFGKTILEFSEVAARIAQFKPDLVEVNVSCPNVASEFGASFAADAAICRDIAGGVKNAVGAIPVAMKLSLQCPSIASVAQACVAGGADAITAINTVGPGMLIDVDVRKPILANQVGGMSGPAILPLAVRAVYEIAEAVTVPIIGTGGVTCAEDAVQLILAGATAVGIGTGVYTRGVGVFAEAEAGLRDYLERHRLRKPGEIRGKAHV